MLSSQVRMRQDAPIRDVGVARMPDDDVLLTKAEVAELLHVSQRTIDRWAKAGKGPPSFILPSNGRRRWRRGDVLAWLSKQP
jgi:excisionase family DNA binding protein